MKELIKRILREEQETPVLTKKEILLFKYINDNKQKAGTKSEMIKFIQEMLRYFGMPLNEATMYYEIYTANFRPDGDYENLTKENFKDYRLFKQRKVANNSAYEYATAKMPFKGSNVEGQWNVNNNNDWYYEIKSYGYYPVFLFINNQWYRVSNSYSSSTAKQISHANPRRGGYDSNIKMSELKPKDINNNYSSYDKIYIHNKVKYIDNVKRNFKSQLDEIEPKNRKKG